LGAVLRRGILFLDEAERAEHPRSGLRRARQRSPKAKDPPPGEFSRPEPVGGVASQSNTHEGYFPLSRLAIQSLPQKQHHSEFSDRL
jgi:hypothetical protein